MNHSYFRYFFLVEPDSDIPTQSSSNHLTRLCLHKCLQKKLSCWSTVNGNEQGALWLIGDFFFKQALDWTIIVHAFRNDKKEGRQNHNNLDLQQSRAVVPNFFRIRTHFLKWHFYHDLPLYEIFRKKEI